jgi:hypothetical protein
MLVTIISLQIVVDAANLAGNDNVADDDEEDHDTDDVVAAPIVEDTSVAT